MTLVGESIGAVIALTSAADVPERIRAVYALNTYDYETRYADGLRRGNLFANLIIGGLQVPIFGAIAAAITTRWIIGNVMKVTWTHGNCRVICSPCSIRRDHGLISTTPSDGSWLSGAPGARRASATPL